MITLLYFGTTLEVRKYDSPALVVWSSDFSITKQYGEILYEVVEITSIASDRVRKNCGRLRSIVLKRTD